MNYVLDNMNIVPESDAVIQTNDRSYHFGDGVYEVVRVYNQTPFQLDAHWDRLFQSAQKLDMNFTITADELTKATMDLLEKNQVKDGAIYIQVSRGASPRNHLYSREETPIITGFTMSAPPSKQQEGIAAWVTDDMRWLRCDIKTVNLLGNVMAKREAADADCAEAILHRDGLVTEGSSSNLFLVNDGILYTHPATNLILNGITRQVVIKLATDAGFRVVEEAFPKDVLDHADEAFITSTTSEVTPIVEFKGQITAQMPIGPVTKKLQALFKELI
ncbi:D-amino-acid transaminase [Alkalicoccobacillus plakortidis]|uniref:D-alanine aminotransferase n=1 Tax=Alkalicoccobacillus plakortidis TaxID=444060 RepID=A0ABT0XGI7_9BACI|nr:D-amino-acid transaminase [Alkalicoccobacillus plakortidis]MCM2674994.1 D-amino-acid transaminase [Alkalicoccobacillus plakortidis]